MIGQARVVGGLLLAGGAMLGTVAIMWLRAARADGSLAQGGFTLGLFFVLALILPVMAAGVYLLVKGRTETAEHARAAQTRKLLNMVLTQGQVRIADAVVELGLPREEVREIIYDAVGRGLFSGYVSWRAGVLYAREAAQGVQDCPNCGGTITIAGRGVFQCPYCGTEIFLARGESERHEIQGVAPPADQAGPVAPPPDGDAAPDQVAGR